MDNLAELCRKKTNLSAMQIELLKRAAVCLDFAADLTRSPLFLFVSAKDEKKFLLIKKSLPHTVYVPDVFAGEGDFVGDVRALPVASRSAGEDFGCVLPKESDAKTFAVGDETKPTGYVTAVQLFGRTVKESIAVFDTARIILKDAEKAGSARNRDMYGRILPGDGVLIADRFSRIIYADSAAAGIYRVLSVNSLMSRRLDENLLLRYVTKETVTVKRPWEKEIEAGGLILRQRDMRFAEGGNLLRRVIVLSDITELREKDEALRVQSAIIKETHHRVKNNLEIVAGLLRMQLRRSGSDEVKSALAKSVERIMSIAVVHDFLAKIDSENVSVRDIAEYFFRHAAKNMADENFRLDTVFVGDDVSLPPKMLRAFSLILNELLINAVEHAFKDREAGRITLAAKTAGGEIMFEFCDDGCGFDEKILPRKKNSLGTEIIKTLVESELEGTFCLSGEPGVGARAKITMPIPSAK